MGAAAMDTFQEHLRQFLISQANGHELDVVKSEVVGGYTTYNQLGDQS